MAAPLLPVVAGGGGALAGAGSVLLPVAAGLALPALLGGGALVTTGGAVLGGIKAGQTLSKLARAGKAVAELADVVGQEQSSAELAEPTHAAGPPSFDGEQLGNIRVIADEVAGAPLPQALAASRPALTVAMVVNAWHESRLRAGATNLVGRDSSYGLFQVNRQGALGRPYSPEQLLHPRFNTRVILTEVWTRRAELETVARSGTVAHLVAAFTAHVERPADRFRRGQERSSTARAWYGAAVDRPAYRWAV